MPFAMKRFLKMAMVHCLNSSKVTLVQSASDQPTTAEEDFSRSYGAQGGLWSDKGQTTIQTKGRKANTPSILGACSILRLLINCTHRRA
jgi:hypothetical protein